MPHMLLFNHQQAALQLILLCPYLTSVDEMDLQSPKLASRCFNYNKGVEEIQDLQFKRKLYGMRELSKQASRSDLFLGCLAALLNLHLI